MTHTPARTEAPPRSKAPVGALRVDRASTVRLPGPALRLLAGLAILAVIFGAGAYLYVHGAGSVASHSSRLPAPLLLALALVGGAASFFSPCSIAITPSFIGYLAGADTSGAGSARRRLLAPAGLVACGILAFYAAAGAAIGAVGAVAYNYLVYLLPVIAVLFFVLGYLLLTGTDAQLRIGAANPINRFYEAGIEAKPQARSRGRLFGFGCAYGAASHACTLPIFLGIVLAPIAAGDFVLAAGATLLYGLAIAAILLILAAVGEGALAALPRRFAGHFLGVATGGLFVLTGGYLLYYFIQNYGGLL